MFKFISAFATQKLQFFKANFSSNITQRAKTFTNY